MQELDFKELFYQLFGININESNYRNFDFEKKFSKKVLKLKGKETFNLLNKILEILKTKDLSHYKNLKHNLKKYKRVHINSSYVIIFYDDKTKKVYFVDYAHHNKIYKK